jgi:UDP-glucose 4-epimerase
MLVHLNSSFARPARVVVMGAAGFVGGAIARRLARDGVPVLALGRKEVDLCAAGAAAQLASLLRPDDAFVAVSARAPCKNADMLVENAVIATAMSAALTQSPVAHVVNIGSDAVYADSADPLTESSCASPNSLHGAMHLSREVVLRSTLKSPFATLRPTLIFGAGDPHNGYGPNRFRRQAMRGEDITLFGNGEERRDHVFVDDVAELVVRALYRRSTGALNIATGEVRSFHDIAEHAVRLCGKPVAIRGTPRSGPLPHNGYRPFDIAAVRKAFPDFRFTSFDEAYARTFAGEKPGSN